MNTNLVQGWQQYGSHTATVALARLACELVHMHMRLNVKGILKGLLNKGDSYVTERNLIPMVKPTR